MKVTVNFGSVRVIVPCGEGDVPVKQLMDLAITRYKKATGKTLDSWVTIQNLKLLSDGGILDPDDLLSDVADDREQIIAEFDEQNSSYLMHNGGDGTSASSIGTESPDFFQNGDIISSTLSKSSYNGSDMEMAAEKITTGLLPLHVRRGSEPALNRISPSIPNGDPCKRWSAAALPNDENGFKHLNSEGENSEASEDESPPGEREDGSGEEKSLPYQQCNGSWVCDPQDIRKEPLGGPITSPTTSIEDVEDSDSSNASSKKTIEVIKMKNEEGPLGIHIVPADDSPEKNNGVIIQGIEPGGRIDRDGRFHIGDRITEINGLKLSKESYHNAQEILKDALKAPELSIHCIKKEPEPIASPKKSPPPLLPKPVFTNQKKMSDVDRLAEDEKSTSVPKSILSSPSRKSPASMLIKGTPTHSSIRKIGRRILIHLKKGSEGLGFSITSKDPNNGPPFFIKNILPAGAAVDDGRLKTGDKIVEVNKTDVSNMVQTEVLDLLRKVPFNEVVELVVSRLETDMTPSPSLPRQLPPEKVGDEVSIHSCKKRDVFTYEVALNDTGSAGLGVSVKGKTSNNAKGALDMGIFLKSIFHGGAASKDGRLCINDQLLNVNGISLVGMTNGQAMETLRRAMIQGEGPNVVSNAIILTVARRVPSPLSDNPSDQGDTSGHDRSDSLLSESGDSFYVSNENLSPPSNKYSGPTPDTSTSDHSTNTVIFMTPRTQTGDLIELRSPHSPIPENSPAFQDSNPGSGPECYQFFGSGWNSPDKSQTGDLMDLSLDDLCSPLVDTNGTEGRFQSGSVVINHQKSFSSPVKMDLPSPLGGGISRTQRMQQINDCGARYSPKLKHKFTTDRNSRLCRSGFGRQSMPEKSFHQSSHFQINQYTPNENHIGRETIELGATSPKQHCQKFPKYSSPREMAVDVGNIETYVKFQPKKPHRTRGAATSPENSNQPNCIDYISDVNRGHTPVNRACKPELNLRKKTPRTMFFYPTCCLSCNSPDCPYHAVPTTDSGQGICSQVGPSLGMFKSSSLESLQTMVQDQIRRDSVMAIANKESCTRVCNESFRAAVDKSFEVVDEDAIEALNFHNDNRQAVNGSRHMRSTTVDSGQVAMQDKKNGKSSKKKGLFRGLGSVFRFGKSSKKAESSPTTTKESKEMEKLQARAKALNEQERIQQRYQELMERQRQVQTPNPQQPLPSPNRHISSKASFTFPRVHNQNVMLENTAHLSSPQNRQERMYILRAEHQKRHQQRNGYYPKEDQEELYEQRIKQIVDCKTMRNRPLPPLPRPKKTSNSSSDETPQGNDLELSPKSRTLDLYKEMSKPGSRRGFADPNRYSHYMNFQEIQQHLQQFQHPQGILTDGQQNQDLPHFLADQLNANTPPKRQYRHTVSSPRSRPLSEFLDYDSSYLSKSPMKQLPGSGSLPRRAFASSRPRPPIPTYMIYPEQNKAVMNGHLPTTSYYNQSSLHGFNDSYYAKKETPGSKV